jgi:hypothetical protein
MDSPQNHIWGPHLWTILHSTAEKIGSSPIRRLPQEEQRIWLGLLSSLRYSLPCPQCKKHYSDYYARNPIKEINRELIRKWLYNLHNQVNNRNEKAVSITIEQIPEIYSAPINFSVHLKIVSEQMGRALRHDWMSRDDMQRSLRFLNEIKRFYDYF